MDGRIASVLYEGLKTDMDCYGVGKTVIQTYKVSTSDDLFLLSNLSLNVLFFSDVFSRRLNCLVIDKDEAHHNNERP
jgi:hypothetical protein